MSNITHLRYKSSRISRYVILVLKMWEKVKLFFTP